MGKSKNSKPGEIRPDLQDQVVASAAAAVVPAAKPGKQSKVKLKSKDKPKSKAKQSKDAVEAKSKAAAKSKSKAKPKLKQPAQDFESLLAAAQPKPGKLVRDSFTMPSEDFGLIAQLKERALEFRRPTKKSELLRAGLQLLASLEKSELQEALEQLRPLKVGRPKHPR